jgi:hypothetical protein
VIAYGVDVSGTRGIRDYSGGFLAATFQGTGVVEFWVLSKRWPNGTRIKLRSNSLTAPIFVSRGRGITVRMNENPA